MMTRACITAVASVAAFAIGAASAAHAAAGTAPFQCNARHGTTCVFKLFLGPRYTRVVWLPSGMTVNIPGVNIGSDRYCVGTHTPPVFGCAQTVIKATLNH
jgi:hypothetical protein